MQPQISVVTLAVADLDRSLTFYRDGLGFPTDGIVGDEFPGSECQPAGRAAMFTLDSGLILSLYPTDDLVKDAGLPMTTTRGQRFSLGHTVGSVSEVGRVLSAAQRAGGRVVGPVGRRPWGIYSGYFTDPDGHLWEVVHFLPAN